MGIRLGADWELIHLTDRTVEIRKDTPAYRRFTGAPGYVRIRGEPGMDRKQLTDMALETAQRTDEELAKRVAKALMPSARSLAKYRAEQAHWEPVFRVPDEEKRIYAP